MRKPFLLFFFCIALHCSASAQTWEIGGFVGGSGYLGDINPVRPYKLTDLAFGGQIKRNFNGYWSAKGNAMYGNIRANDARSVNEYQQVRNINFSSPVLELTLQVEFNLFNYLPGVFDGVGNKRLSPYLFTGIGGVFFEPKATFEDETYKLRDYGTEGQDGETIYKNYAMTVPYGAGVKYNITKNWNLIGEAGYRTARTDYLDDVSGYYPDFTGLVQDGYSNLRKNLSDPSVTEIGRPNTQRGDFRKRDTYLFVGVSLTYTFVSLKCATF